MKLNYLLLILVAGVVIVSGCTGEETCEKTPTNATGPTGECQEFDTNCIPEGWTVVEKCPVGLSPTEALAKNMNLRFKDYAAVDLVITKTANNCDLFPERSDCILWEGRILKTGEQAGQSEVTEYYYGKIYQFTNKAPEDLSIGTGLVYNHQIDRHGGKKLIRRFKEEGVYSGGTNWDVAMIFYCDDYHWAMFEDTDFGSGRTVNGNDLRAIATSVMDMC